ncbi:tetratricopeptide repeat protein [uncultured Maricaulis sp.]|uniref:tetratricopeptide repeat protein n=1 Tax=uncultured Maricaulis sp. TaxID=174710 RepID=UPI00262DB1FD|nr:tetratricopeptide repeat protein [uncultured Maricaulis sp.]
MSSSVRMLALCLAATAFSSCASTSAPPEEGGSVYGAFLAARYAGVNRDVDGAATHYARALDQAPGNATLADRAFITTLLSGNTDQAAQLARSTVQAGDPSRLATLYVAADQIAERRYRDAIASLEAAPDYGPFNTLMRDLLIQWAMMGEGQAVAAMDAANETQAPGFLSSHLWLHKAMLADVAGEAEAADAAYRTAAYSAVFPRLATEMYGNFLEREGRPDEARALYETMLEANPDGPFVTDALRRLDEGARPRRRPGVAQMAGRALFGPASDLAEQADMDLSVIYLRMVQRLDPDYAPTRLALAGTLSRISLPDAALAEYAAITDAPFRFTAEFQRILLLQNMQRTEEANLLANRLWTEDGGVETKLLVADLRRINGQCGEAIPLYEAIIADRDVPADWRYHYYAAACYLDQDDWASAEGHYLAALELAPNEATLLNDLGYFWIDRGERIEEAFAMIQQAADADPSNGNVIDSLGWAHYRLGHYEAAVEALERAAALAPGNATANYHLGDAYWQVGRELEAGFQWRRTLDLDPRPEQREGLEYRLTHGRPPNEEQHVAQELTTAGDDTAGEP